MSRLTNINDPTTPSKSGRAFASDLTPHRVKANPKIVIRWKTCDCVCCVVREAAVNYEIFCARSSRSCCYFVPLRRVYDGSTEAWM